MTIRSIFISMYEFIMCVCYVNPVSGKDLDDFEEWLEKRKQ